MLVWSIGIKYVWSIASRFMYKPSPKTLKGIGKNVENVSTFRVRISTDYLCVNATSMFVLMIVLTYKVYTAPVLGFCPLRYL